MLEEDHITCPYCWETIAVDVDVSAGSQTYTEDCSVCCNPILIRLQVSGDGETYEIEASPENE